MKSKFRVGDIIKDDEGKYEVIKVIPTSYGEIYYAIRDLSGDEIYNDELGEHYKLVERNPITNWKKELQNGYS